MEKGVDYRGRSAQSYGSEGRARFGRGALPVPVVSWAGGLGGGVPGPGGDKILGCGVHDLYDGQQMRFEKLEAWRALRERYGNRDESRVDRGTLFTRPPDAS